MKLYKLDQNRISLYYKKDQDDLTKNELEDYIKKLERKINHRVRYIKLELEDTPMLLANNVARLATEIENAHSEINKAYYLIASRF